MEREGSAMSSLQPPRGANQQEQSQRPSGGTRWHGARGTNQHRRASPDPSSAAPPLQATPKVTPPPVLSRPRQGLPRLQPATTRCSTCQKQGNFPKVVPEGGAVPVRRREERVWEEVAITHESGRSPGAPCPLSSPAAGRRHLPSPPRTGKGLPVRHFRGRNAEVKDCACGPGGRDPRGRGTEGRRPEGLAGNARRSGGCGPRKGP